MEIEMEIIRAKNNSVWGAYTEPSLTIKGKWLIQREVLARKGIPLSYFAGTCEMTTDKQFNYEYVVTLSNDMMSELRADFLKLNSEVEIEVYQELNKAQLQKELSKIQTEISDRTFIQELSNMTSAEKAELIRSFDVFKVQHYANQNILHISTSMTLSMASWKRCRKLNAGKYLPTVEFSVVDDLKIVLELIDISKKTKKISQAKLNEMKKARFANKRSSTSSFQHWYDEAEFPEKVNGRWTDVGTGINYD